MFKIMTKHMNIHELKLLKELWYGMWKNLHKSKYCKVDCDGCKYKRLCKAIQSAGLYLDKTLEKRETQE